MSIKHCPACKKDKASWAFKTEESYSCLMCDSHRRARVNRYKARNREFVNQIARDWRKNNPGAAVAAVMDWQKRNPENVREYRKNTHLRAMKNPNYRLALAVRARIHQAVVGGKKSAATEELMGGSGKYRAHVEKLLRPEWTWENYGIVWEIDHRRPICSFKNLASDPAEQRAAFHYSNVQPLSVKDNRSKGGRWEDQFPCH